MIKIKQVYEKVDKSDGFRILVDGAWPRGVNKQDGNIDLWVRQIAPTPPLNRWGFLKKIQDLERDKGTVTLIYSAKDRRHNNAVVLKEYLDNMRKKVLM